MRKLLLVAALLSTTAFAAPAFAQTANNATTTRTYHTQTQTTYYHWNPFAAEAREGMTLGAQVGATFPDETFDDDAVYNLSLGWQFHPMIRADIEAGYRNVDIDSSVVSGDADVWTLMVNGYWDFKNSTIVTPYIGAGIGYAHQRLESSVGDDNDGAFAYQGIAGLSFQVTDQVALTAQYNYIDATSFDYSASEVKGGVRVTF